MAGIFGANASGKSNVLHALAYMRRFVLQSDREVEPGLGLSRDPFRLDTESVNAPSRYVVDALIGGVRHTYGFSLDDERVLEEWLYHYPLKKRRRVFERDNDGFEWGEESGKRTDLDRIAEITAPTALFLSTAARFTQGRVPVDAADPMHDVYRWFFRFRTRRTPPPHYRWPENHEDQMVVTGLLRAADIGIVDVSLRAPALEISPGPLLGPEATDPATARRVGDAELRRLHRLQFSHQGLEISVDFDIADESAGTRQLLELAIDAAYALRGGGTMVVDEIDASLHPMLTAKLVGLFQNVATNPLQSQLFFTSHDAALLGTFDMEEVLHRDQVWFTDKDRYGASTLYPLSDFKPRKEGENRQRRYLSGNYGGVPDLSADLFEQALRARGEIDAEPSQ
ncbi:MAG TPA: ATP-binding protein [Micromonosporaceae bacterium]|nr:ATP-binding protein [Micromonosporaceae bacterium]